MNQSEFQRALQKHHKRKQRLAAQSLAEDPKPKVDPALPFAEMEPKPKKVPQPHVQMPRPKPMEVTITGPLNLSFKIDWSGTLLGSQLTEPTLRKLFSEGLKNIGRVT